VRHALYREMDLELGCRDNSESRLATLVTLYALSPLPATAVDLAYHAEVSRASMKGVIEALERHSLILRKAASRRHIAEFSLTELGQQAAVFAVHRFLKLASELAADIGSSNRTATVETCERIASRAAAFAP
jgi:DNA-binding MarR family transcriptional regulator